MVMQSTPRTLAGLETEQGAFYLYGDPEKRPILPRMIGPPKVIEGVPFGTLYSAQARAFTRQAPPAANAFVLGAPVPSPGPKDTEYCAIVQFCAISADDYARSSALPKREWGIKGMVYENRQYVWIRMEAV